MKECAVEAAPWNREIRGIGAGIYHSEASSPKEVGGPVVDESETGFGIWGAYARPAGTNGQFAFSAQLTENLIRERKQDQETVQETVDGWRVSGRYTHKLAEVKTDKNSTLVRGFIEASYASEKFGDIDDEFTQAGIGLEVPLSNGMYFQLTYGDTWGSDIKRDDYLMGQVKWSLSGAAAS